VSSQLLEYEVWNRMHAYGLGRSHASEAQALFIRVDLIEMTAAVLARALEPFPIRVRTLDGLQLATVDGLKEIAARDASPVTINPIWALFDASCAVARWLRTVAAAPTSRSRRLVPRRVAAKLLASSPVFMVQSRAVAGELDLGDLL
jgi:hypothetical protein